MTDYHERFRERFNDQYWASTQGYNDKREQHILDFIEEVLTEEGDNAKAGSRLVWYGKGRAEERKAIVEDLKNEHERLGKNCNEHPNGHSNCRNCYHTKCKKVGIGLVLTHLRSRENTFFAATRSNGGEVTKHVVSGDKHYTYPEFPKGTCPDKDGCNENPRNLPSFEETEYCAGCDYELSTAIKAPNHTCSKGTECCDKCAYPLAKEQGVDESSGACNYCGCHGNPA